MVHGFYDVYPAVFCLQNLGLPIRRRRLYSLAILKHRPGLKVAVPFSLETLEECCFRKVIAGADMFFVASKDMQADELLSMGISDPARPPFGCLTRKALARLLKFWRLAREGAHR